MALYSPDFADQGAFSSIARFADATNLSYYASFVSRTAIVIVIALISSLTCLAAARQRFDGR